MKHDEFLNTYTLYKDGRKITLAPLAPQNIIKPKFRDAHKDWVVYLSFLEPTLLAKNHEFKPLKEMILFSSSQNDQNKAPAHPLALKRIQSFCHVFLDEIPSSLPPKRTIQHYIDLISAGILPSKPTYRMNPKDTQEIQRQVE